MRFSHIPIPRERHPTAAARSSLSKRLGFQDSDEIQDWEIFFQNPARLGEFLALYRNGGLDRDEKFLLMDLILASAADAAPVNLQADHWKAIEAALNTDYETHHWLVWHWAAIDETTGIAYNSNNISRRLQRILADRFAEQPRRQGDTPPEPAMPPDGPFSIFWRKYFYGHLPAGFCLRKFLPDHWARFHSLPESKRYAESEAERSMLLDRANTLLGDILGEDEVCWLIVCRRRGCPIVPGDRSLDNFDFETSFTWSETEGFDPLEDMTASAAECQWNSGQFNELIKRAADFEEPIVLWISQSTRSVFAPYDGGFDLIIPDRRKIMALKAHYADWLPKTAAGL